MTNTNSLVTAKWTGRRAGGMFHLNRLGIPPSLHRYTNGFVCNVDRSWMDQSENSPEFWNPKRLGPVCYDPQRTPEPLQTLQQGRGFNLWAKRRRPRG